MLKAAIFDLDGLLIDSEPLWGMAEIAVFSRLGIPMTEELCLETKGLRINEVVDYWERRFSVSFPSSEVVAESIVERLIELIHERGQAKPGIENALHWCEQHRLALALASSSNLRIINAALAKLGLGKIFTEIHSGENEPYGKPHPGIYLTAMQSLGLQPHQCLAIEDSLNGVLAAKSARMHCIAIPDPYQGHSPAFAIADVTIPSLQRLDEQIFMHFGNDK